MQKILLDGVEKHLSSYLDDWQYLSTQGETSPVHDTPTTAAPTIVTPTINIQEIITHYWHKYGIRSRYLNTEQTLLYAETGQPATHTLLFHASIPPDMTKQKAFIFPLLTTIAAYQQYQTISSLPSLALKWLIEVQQPLGTENALYAQGSLEQACTTEQSLLQADGCILYSTHSELCITVDVPQLILGTKGMLEVELIHQTAQQATIPAQYGAIAPNAAWQLLWLLNSLKDEREDIQIEGFYDQLVVLEDEALVSLPTLPQTATATKDIDQLVAGLQGAQQHYAYFLTPTCSITALQSSYPPTTRVEQPTQPMLPTVAKAQLDFRLVPAQDPYDIYNKLQHHLQDHGHKQIQTRLLSAYTPAATPVHEPLIAITRQAFQTTYHADPVIVPLGAFIPSFSTLRQHLALPTIAITPPCLYSHEQHTEEFVRFAKGIALILANFASMPEN
jgi:hypothetical protein